MKCSYCEKDATHYAYWHRDAPRPNIHEGKVKLFFGLHIPIAGNMMIRRSS